MRVDHSFTGRRCLDPIYGHTYRIHEVFFRAWVVRNVSVRVSKQGERINWSLRGLRRWVRDGDMVLK